jgi:hypothetical protein
MVVERSARTNEGSVLGRSPALDAAILDEPSVLIEVSGPNVVIRATPDVDQAYTASLAEVVNAASATDTCVVIDPHPIRCDDDFATYQPPDGERSCLEHHRCRPTRAEVAAPGVVRVGAEGTVWMIDVRNGRFCQLSTDVDPRFIGESAWRPLVAICVTPTWLIALGADGDLRSARRAHLTSAA